MSKIAKYSISKVNPDIVRGKSGDYLYATFLSSEKHSFMKFCLSSLAKASIISRFALMVCLSSSVIAPAFAQNNQTKKEADAAYYNVVKQRASKIVSKLGIADPAKEERVQTIIAQQYQNLNNVHTSRDEQIKAVKAKVDQGKEAIAADVKAIEKKADKKLAKLHKKYLKQLGKQLTEEQVVQVKDGMTYGVLPITYNGYMQMLPNLTEEQKKQIMAWLVEAREKAMDAESSEKKHWWFGKYKGRINNYLSASGINMKQAGEEWQKRIKAEQEAKKSK
jgi:mRNA-degrading endonuclease RelE of RelBE toxin-antitoxin system